MFGYRDRRKVDLLDLQRNLCSGEEREWEDLKFIAIDTPQSQVKLAKRMDLLKNARGKVALPPM